MDRARLVLPDTAHTLGHNGVRVLLTVPCVTSVTFETRRRNGRAKPNNRMNWDAHYVRARYAGRYSA
jgi:hypothetical protein